MTKYTYSIINDTLNGKVGTDRLQKEIVESAIVTAIDHIETAGDVMDIWFKAALSSGDEDILDGLVAEHSGLNLPDTAMPVAIDGVKLEDERIYVAQNRVPPGYTLYAAGRADNIGAGTFGGGTQLKFDANNTSKEFQLLNHYYVIGARSVWQACSVDCAFNGTLIAPASSGFTQAAGDFAKVQIVPGVNLFKPVAAGTGAWSGNLADKFTNTQILKATPVPIEGNTGWFDYDSANNVLTPRLDQKGGYNLFDVPINLHAFARDAWGMADGEMNVMVDGLVGKMIFNSWKLKLDLTIVNGAFTNEKVGVMVLVATKRNI